METIRNVLVLDKAGQTVRDHRLIESSDWDDIKAWSDRIYMPYCVSPVGRNRRPDSVLDAARIGHFTFSRFRYGIPVNIKDFSSEAGTGVLLTTVEGAARHWAEPDAYFDTGVGESFLVDNSRTHYWVDFDAAHLQVNLTFSHDSLASLHERWFGCPADERMWRIKFKFGGHTSGWISLLSYVCQCLTEVPEAIEFGALGRHLEELIGVHLLTEWRRQMSHSSPPAVRRLAPRHVVVAERFIEENARLSPTLGDLARAAGVSVRTLTYAFRSYRGTTPMAAVRERRLIGVQEELLTGTPGLPIRQVAEAWGFVNMGVFSCLFRKRFGEPPSETRRRR